MLQRRRTRDDARAYAVMLTDAGAKILKSYDPLARRVDDRVLASLPAQQRDRFLQDLNTIVRALSRLKEKAQG
jgi:DNA-binding MarR family transcriptional regulator